MQSKVKGILYNQNLKWLKATLFKVNYFPLEKVVIGRYFSVSSNMPPSVNESQSFMVFLFQWIWLVRPLPVHCWRPVSHASQGQIVWKKGMGQYVGKCVVPKKTNLSTSLLVNRNVVVNITKCYFHRYIRRNMWSYVIYKLIHWDSFRVVLCPQKKEMVKEIQIIYNKYNYLFNI